MEKEVKEKNSKKGGLWWKITLIVLLIIIIILLLLRSCGKGDNKYKIKLHYGDEEIEVDPDFKLTDLDVDGGVISFLVDSYGHIVDPNEKLDKDKEYSAHIIPNGKEKVKVTYKTDNSSLVIEYQKGAGLLFPEDPKKEGYVFIAWKYEDIDDYPIYMMPVEHDMVIVAVFEKSTEEGGKCTLNCDTNKDGKCDLNCDKDGDGKPDTNVDTDGDGKPDLNIDKDHDNICDLNCDTDKDGKPDTNIDTNGDGNPDTNIDTNKDGKPDTNIDKDGDGSCDENCDEGILLTDTEIGDITFSCYEQNAAHAYYRPSSVTFISFKFDGKDIPESEFVFDEFDDDKLIYDYSSYIGSGKTVDVEFKVIVDGFKGQKYYRIMKAQLTFKGECDKVNEITYKCEDYDNDGGFLFVSPVPKKQVKYTKVDGNEIEPKSYKEEKDESYPIYDLSDYFEDEKTLNIEIGYNYYDDDFNLYYRAKVIFPKCEFGASEYTLTLDPNGGSVNPTNRTLIVGQVIYDLPFPTRNGYQFVGWYTEKNGGELVDDNSDTTMPNHDMTLYAQWESNETPKGSYTLTYNPNGGTVSPKSKTLKEGATYGNLPTPSKVGYTFDGWYTKADGGTKVSANTKIYGNTTIYAHWLKRNEPTPTPTPTKQKYTLTYNANGGSVSPSSKELTEGDAFGSLPTPTRNGYDFEGWYTSANGGTKVDANTKISANTTIYAHWKEQKDNGTISLSASKSCIVKGQSVTVTARVSNARDNTINWTNDRCLTLSGTGESRTVTANGCGKSGKVTATLNNGATSSVTLNYEDALTFTVTDRGGGRITPDGDGVYNGNYLTITTNVPAYITGRSISGDGSTLRTSVTTKDWSDTITIRTECGQTKTVLIHPIIN